MAGDFDDFEPVIDDARVARYTERILNEYPSLPEGTFLVTFITEDVRKRDRETGEMRHYHVPPRANFAIVSENPRSRYYPILLVDAQGNRKRPPEVMTMASVYLDEFRERDRTRVMFVGQPDPAEQIFRVALADHLKKLENLRSLDAPPPPSVPSASHLLS